MFSASLFMAARLIYIAQCVKQSGSKCQPLDSTPVGSMKGSSLGRCLALSGAGNDLDKASSIRSPCRMPHSPSTTDSGHTITSVDALIKDLRQALYAMFHPIDASSHADANDYSHRAFNYFTTTNTITQEGFYHKVVQLGLQATRRVCNELFRCIDQTNVGAIDSATFAQRVVQIETFLPPDESARPVTGSCGQINLPQAPTLKDTNAHVASPRLSRYESMALDDLETCVARKLKDKLPKGSCDFTAQALRYSSKVETMAFADFHRHLGLLQIIISPSKCRELFDRFDKDGDGVIDTIEFVKTLLPSNCRPPYRPSSGALCDTEPTVSTKQLVATLKERMDELLEETDREQQTYLLFGKPTGISFSDFQTAMKRLGVNLSSKQLAALFATFDVDKTGDLNVHKVAQEIMLDDNSMTLWRSMKDQQLDEDSRRNGYSLAVPSVQESWTTADIERMLREKIEQRTSRSSDCFRQAYRIFKKVNGINPIEFHAALETIGLALTRLQSDTLFCRFDKDRSGDIDLTEFIHGVLPPDYTGVSWVAAADEMHRLEAKKKQDAMATADQFLDMERWSLNEIETLIRDKIQQRTSRSSDTFRQAFKIFKKASHVTINDFRDRLFALGFRLTPAQYQGLFQRYDTNNSNALDLQDFWLKILPPDYTQDGDHWSHSAKCIKEQQRQKLDHVKRSQNGLLRLPKFIESHRFSRGHYATHVIPTLHVKDSQMFDTHSEQKGPSDALRPSTGSYITDLVASITPRPPCVSQPSTLAFKSSGLHRALSPHHSCGRTTRLSSTSPQAAPSNVSVADLQTSATPLRSAHLMFPTRPMSPRLAVKLASPHHSMSPRRSSLSLYEPAIEYAIEKIREKDESRPQACAHAPLMLSSRPKLGKSHRHQCNSDDRITSRSQVLVRPAKNAAADALSLSSAAVGTAKHMPQRNHVLLIKRWMQAAGQGGEMKNNNRLRGYAP